MAPRRPRPPCCLARLAPQVRRNISSGPAIVLAAPCAGAPTCAASTIPPAWPQRFPCPSDEPFRSSGVKICKPWRERQAPRDAGLRFGFPVSGRKGQEAIPSPCPNHSSFDVGRPPAPRGRKTRKRRHPLVNRPGAQVCRACLATFGGRSVPETATATTPSHRAKPIRQTTHGARPRRAHHGGNERRHRHQFHAPSRAFRPGTGILGGQ